jgi:acyl-coenzyme A thioesterase PaaI-like protein
MPEQSRADVIRAFIPASPFARELGIELVDLRLDEAELRLPYEPRLATLGDVVHGGAIAALLDTAGMAAAWSGAGARCASARSRSPTPRATSSPTARWSTATASA